MTYCELISILLYIFRGPKIELLQQEMAKNLSLRSILTQSKDALSFLKTPSIPKNYSNMQRKPGSRRYP